MKKKTFALSTSWIGCHCLLLLLGAAFTAQAAPTTNSWLYDIDGDWGFPSYWEPAGPPNEAASMALLTNNLTWPRTIILDVPVTLGTLRIGSLDGLANLVIAGVNPLTLDNGGAGARLLSPTGNDADAITAPLVLADHLTVDGAKKITIGAISESVLGRSITKEGDGTVVLSTASSYSGGLVINGGAVQIDAETSLGAVPTEPTPGNLAINGGTFVFNTSSILNKARGVHLGGAGGTMECRVQAGLYGVIEGPGRLIKTGPKALFLATNFYAGGTWLKEGGLRLGSTSPAWSQLGSGDLTMENDTSLVAWSTTARTLTNRVIVKGNITLGAASGDTAALTLSGPVVLGDDLRTITTLNTADVISGEISGDGGIIKAGVGRLSLMNLNNSFSGGVVVAEGLLRIGAHSSLGTGTLTLNDGAAFSSDGNSNRQPTNSVVINGNVTIGQPSGVGAGSIYLRGPVELGSEVRTIVLGNTVADYIIGNISGVGGIIKRGAPSLAIFGANTFEGGFTVAESIVLYYGDSAFGSGLITMGEPGTAGGLTISGEGTVANDIEVVAGVSGARTLSCTNYGTAVYSGNINLGAELTVGAVAAYPRTIILSGSVSGGGSLRMNGAAPANIVILSGANTYLGNTTVAGGILVVSNATGSATSGGAVTAQANAVLAGTGMIDGAVTVDSGATLSPGLEGVGRLTINNILTLAAGSTNLMELDKSANTNDVVVANTVNCDGTLLVANRAGTLANGDSFKLFSAGSFSGNFAEVVLLDSALTAQFDPATGTLSISGGVASSPTNITFSVSGNTLALSWPESHLGWYAQSNSVSVAEPNAWHDIAGSETVTNLDLTINPGLPQIYYRLRQP